MLSEDSELKQSLRKLQQISDNKRPQQATKQQPTYSNQDVLLIDFDNVITYYIGILQALSRDVNDKIQQLQRLRGR